MRVSSIVSSLLLGFSAVKGLSHGDLLKARGLEARAKPAAPNTIVADGRTCINVPQTYAAFMDTNTGAWDRYQCDSGPVPINKVGQVTNAADRQLATKEIIVCMDINLISKGGVIKTHIPPTVCPALKGYKGTDKPSKGALDDYKALKAACTKLIKDHGAKMPGFIVEIVKRRDSGFDNAAAKQALADLFGINLTPKPIESQNQDDRGSVTRVQLDPRAPKLFVDGKDVGIKVPS